MPDAVRGWVAAVLAARAPGWRMDATHDAAINVAGEPVLALYLGEQPEPSAHVADAQLVIALADDAARSANLARTADDGCYIWPENATHLEPDSAFEQWLALGLALAQARHAAHVARRELTTALVDTRRGLAKEIHSGPVQELVAGTFLTSMIPDGAGEPVLAQMQNALGELRAICGRLNPPALDDFGLAAALRTAIRAQAARADGTGDDDSGVDDTGADPGDAPAMALDAELPALEPLATATLYLLVERLFAALAAQEPSSRVTYVGLRAGRATELPSDLASDLPSDLAIEADDAAADTRPVENSATQGTPGLWLRVEWTPVGRVGPDSQAQSAVRNSPEPAAFFALARELVAAVGGRMQPLGVQTTREQGAIEGRVFAGLVIWIPAA